MRFVSVLIFCLASSAPAFAGVQFCNGFTTPVSFAVAFQTPDGWVSEGWVKVKPDECVTDTKHADLTEFFWTAQSDKVKKGKSLEWTTWGKGESFSVKDANFTLKDADRKLKGARLAPFNGPVKMSLPQIVAMVRVQEGSSMVSIPGPNSVLRADPDFKACGEASGDAAMAACSRAIASGKFAGDLLSELYNNRGVEHSAKKDHDGAIADFSEAIRLNAKNILASNNRGNTFFDKGKYDAAIEDYNRAIALDADFIKAYMGRGDSYKEKEEYDRAIDDYKKALTLNPSEDRKQVIERVLSNVYVNRGVDQKDQAARLADYEEAIKLNPSNPVALNNRAALYNEKGDYDRAIADLDQSIKLKPDLAMAFRNRGDAYRGKGDTDHAVADYKQGLSLNPNEGLKKNLQDALEEISSDGSAPASPSTAESKPAAPAPSDPNPAAGVSSKGQVDFRDQ